MNVVGGRVFFDQVPWISVETGLEMEFGMERVEVEVQDLDHHVLHLSLQAMLRFLQLLNEPLVVPREVDLQEVVVTLLALLLIINVQAFDCIAQFDQMSLLSVQSHLLGPVYL